MYDLATNPMADYLNLSNLAKQHGGPGQLLQDVYNSGRNSAAQKIIELSQKNALLKQQVGFYRNATFALGGVLIGLGIIYCGVKIHKKNNEKKQKEIVKSSYSNKDSIDEE